MTEYESNVEPSSSAISTEPIINAVHRRLPEMLVAAYVMLIVYCCFLPFEFGHVLRKGLGDPRLGLYVRPISIGDIVFNIGAYGPVGAGLYFVARRRMQGRVASALLSTVAAVVMSFLIEQGQIYDYLRVPSWIDVVSNSLGAGLGVSCALICEGAVRQVIRRMRAAAARNWWLGVGYAFACFVLAVQLRPYDLAPDIRQSVKYAIQHGDVSPISRWERMPAQLEQDLLRGRRSFGDLSRMRWEYALDRCVDVVLYAGVAALLVVGLGRAGFSTTSSTASAGICVVGVAGTVTLIRIFLISYGLDTATLTCAIVGWGIGTFIGAYVLQTQRRRAAEGRLASMVFAWPTPVTATVVIVVCGLTMGYGLAPFEFDLTVRAPDALEARGSVVPFLGSLGQRANTAILNISTDLLRFGAVGAALAFVAFRLTQSTWRRQTTYIVATVFAMAAAMEALHIWMPTRHIDITHVLLAGVGGFGGAVAARWAQDFRRSVSVVQVQDTLTSQLVDGPTYEPLTVRAPRSQHAGASPMDQEQSNP
ncbi:MAG: VanZ family protein [Planctomycetes bacterium]|nr:VanZ family protein [Planctomycetota bacterium]